MSQPLPLLPRSPHRSSRAAAAASQRDRMLVAMAESAAELGYANATVADAIARAGVSRRTFYDHFADRQECFLAAYDVGVQAMAGGVVERVTPDAAWRDQIRTMLDAFLGLLAGEPIFARISLVEVWAAGPPGLDRYAATIDRFQLVLGELHRRAREQEPSLPPITPVALEVLAGGVNRVATARVLAGHTDELPGIGDELAAFAIATFEAGR